MMHSSIAVLTVKDVMASLACFLCSGEVSLHLIADRRRHACLAMAPCRSSSTTSMRFMPTW